MKSFLFKKKQKVLFISLAKRKGTKRDTPPTKAHFSQPSNLPYPKEGFRPLPKPLANLRQGA